MKTRNLKENLLQNDLAGLVDYVISVDRHTPKLAEQEDVVVMAFECENMDVARDLHHFIGHGTYEDILDIDTSPAPDEDYKFHVFIELPRDKQFIERIQKILGDCSSVCGVENWKLRIFKHKKLVHFLNKKIKDIIVTDPRLYKDKYMTEGSTYDRFKFLATY